MSTALQRFSNGRKRQLKGMERKGSEVRDFTRRRRCKTNDDAIARL
jgi:hypothetical protein